jgi:hypothetical protein
MMDNYNFNYGNQLGYRVDSSRWIVKNECKGEKSDLIRDFKYSGLPISIVVEHP